jgi:lysozyme family protein
MLFDKDLVNTLRYEGGVTTDTGGLTNYGIRQDIYNSYTKANKLQNKSVKELNYGEVRDFYETEYYKKPQIDKLPENLQGVIFDSAVNLGQGTAIKQLQSEVGAKADGKIGEKTIKAVNDYIKNNGEDKLIREVIYSRMSHYQHLSQTNPEKYGKYFDGWYNRIQDLAVKHGTEI